MMGAWLWNFTESLEVWSGCRIKSSLRRNLVEKVNAKKIDLTPNISLENGMCPHFKYQAQ
jgi:hypothetical protein